MFTSRVFPHKKLTSTRSDRYSLPFPLRNRIPPDLTWTRSKKGVTEYRGRTLLEVNHRARPEEDRSRGIEETRGSRRAESFCADHEVTLLSATAMAAEGGGSAVGSVAGRKNDRKSEREREPRTRLGVNLIFYSATRSWCASSSI